MHEKASQYDQYGQHLNKQYIMLLLCIQAQTNCNETQFSSFDRQSTDCYIRYDIQSLFTTIANDDVLLRCVHIEKRVVSNDTSFVHNSQNTPFKRDGPNSVWESIHLNTSKSGAMCQWTDLRLTKGKDARKPRHNNAICQPRATMRRSSQTQRR